MCVRGQMWFIVIILQHILTQITSDSFMHMILDVINFGHALLSIVPLSLMYITKVKGREDTYWYYCGCMIL